MSPTQCPQCKRFKSRPRARCGHCGLEPMQHAMSAREEFEYDRAHGYEEGPGGDTSAYRAKLAELQTAPHHGSSKKMSLDEKADAARAAVEACGGIVGASDIGRRFGVSKQRAAQLIAEHDFPAPLPGTKTAPPRWLASEVDAWRAAVQAVTGAKHKSA